MPQMAASNITDIVMVTGSDSNAFCVSTDKRRESPTELFQREKKPVLRPANMRGKPHMIEKAVASREPVASASLVR